MNEQLNLLISLQEIDSILLSIAGEIELLPDKLEKSRGLLKETRSSFETVKDRFEKLGKEKKQKENELEDFQEKINKFKVKSTEIKTNKEYEAHLKEIKTFEKSKYKIEDEILSIMEELDVLAKDIKKQEERAKRAEEEFKKEEKNLEQKKSELFSKMEIYKIKRNDLVNRIGLEIYEQYMVIMKSAGGVAVVRTQNEICMGCHTNIPPQLYNDIKNTNDIFTCYHCNRFLFYVDPSILPGVEKKNNSIL